MRIVEPQDQINLNGKISGRDAAHVPTDNGAFRYGYGLFETMLVVNGTIRLADYHFERLFGGLQQLYFERPVLMTAGWLEQEVLRTVKKNNLEALCRVRLQMFAGGGGLYSSEARRPQFLIECFALEPDTQALNTNGLTLGIAQGLSKSVDSLSNLKSCNALIYAMGARQAREQQWNDALICNTDGNIIESTLANIFWIKDGQVYTPPLTDGCVAGVMRRHVMETLEVQEQSLTLQQLEAADEIFLTNAIKSVRWVANIGNQRHLCSSINKIYDKLHSLKKP
jgi:branched-chain amino acid aminotransferase